MTNNGVCVGVQVKIEWWKSKEWSSILVTDEGNSMGEWLSQGRQGVTTPSIIDN